MSEIFLSSIPVSFIFYFAAILVFCIRNHFVNSFILLIIPLFCLYQILNIPFGDNFNLLFYNNELQLLYVDKLSRIFGLIFCIAAFTGNLYALHVKDKVQQVATLLYSGSAIGAVFSGDLISLFFYWEGTALASVFLIWARRTEGSFYTGVRYLIIQVLSGIILLTGILILSNNAESLKFQKMELYSLSSWLIFISFGIKAAFPLLHNWLQDSYPASTVTGTVILSAFTTKLAIYALARGFPGTEILIYIGAIMTIFPIFFAEIENDLRRVLAYSLNNQLGFMVVGIGIGTEMALNGTVSHAFAHILYKSLLFMSVGAVLFRTGTSKASDLGGLYKTMPYTMVFCLIGAASISAFPLFSGFVTKSLILDAAAYKNYTFIWLVLVFASAGVLSHSGIKIPYFTFFSHDSGLRPKEAPFHMLLSMGIISFLCIFIGIFPDTLYYFLPYDVIYKPYTVSHVLSQLQLLIFALLAFTILMKLGLHPPEIKAINIDSDWLYRMFFPKIIKFLITKVVSLYKNLKDIILDLFKKTKFNLNNFYSPTSSQFEKYISSSIMLLWISIIFVGSLIIVLF